MHFPLDRAYRLNLLMDLRDEELDAMLASQEKLAAHFAEERLRADKIARLTKLLADNQRSKDELLQGPSDPKSGHERAGKLLPHLHRKAAARKKNAALCRVASGLCESTLTVKLQTPGRYSLMLFSMTVVEVAR